MAILAAFNSPEVEVIGLTTIYGNVPTPMATANALYLRELAGREDVSGGAGRVAAWRGAAGGAGC
jgi:inosine-uridine nucleoside N-ribohydrolase